MSDLVTVCDRCGSEACVGKKTCQYDGLPHGTTDIPAVKAARRAPATRVANPEKRKESH